MFKKVLEDASICKDTINEALSWNIHRIAYFEKEKSMQAFYKSKGIRLDAYVHDEAERVYDVEMQVYKVREEGTTDPTKNLAKRARCYLDEIDMERLRQGDLYSDLHPTFIIFFCPFPLFDGKQCVYRFPRVCANNPSLILPDETELIFITSKGSRDGLSAPMNALLDYMDGKVSDDPLVQRIEKRIHTVKQQEEEERDYMTFEMRIRQERAEASAEGKAEAKSEMIVSMLKEHMHINIIERVSGWTGEKIRALAQANGLAVE